MYCDGSRDVYCSGREQVHRPPAIPEVAGGGGSSRLVHRFTTDFGKLGSGQGTTRQRDHGGRKKGHEDITSVNITSFGSNDALVMRHQNGACGAAGRPPQRARRCADGATEIVSQFEYVFPFNGGPKGSKARLVHAQAWISSHWAAVVDVFVCLIYLSILANKTLRVLKQTDG
ncbi:hypothetical protein FB451DRAFT_1366098 [Mycena latifolia]|nr:hypothetical protein FB451DRAFT_1366098 [Mycena latifolia]